jgi:ABC-type transporter Mla subunit MlaD
MKRKGLRRNRVKRPIKNLGRFATETSRALDLMSDAADILDTLASKFDDAGMNDIGDVYGDVSHKLGTFLRPLRRAQAQAAQRIRKR